MQYNKIVGILLFLIVSAMTAYFALEEPVVEVTEKPFADTAAFDNEYGVEAAVTAAQNRLSNAQEKEKAAIVSREVRQGRTIALAFDGMPKPSALPPLLEVLSCRSERVGQRDKTGRAADWQLHVYRDKPCRSPTRRKTAAGTLPDAAGDWSDQRTKSESAAGKQPGA